MLCSNKIRCYKSFSNYGNIKTSWIPLLQTSTPFSKVKIRNAEFKYRRSSICDNERLDCSKTATTDKNIEKYSVLLNDCCVLKAGQKCFRMDVCQECLHMFNHNPTDVCQSILRIVDAPLIIFVLVIHLAVQTNQLKCFLAVHVQAIQHRIHKQQSTLLTRRKRSQYCRRWYKIAN